MISIARAEQIHHILISQFGGSEGVRDRGALISALSRPYSTFEGHELYPNVVAKAACLIESLLGNHPFLDGNKRTGYVLMRMLLLQEELDIIASEEEKYSFVISIADGKFKFPAIEEWLRAHVTYSTGG